MPPSVVQTPRLTFDAYGSESPVASMIWRSVNPATLGWIVSVHSSRVIPTALPAMSKAAALPAEICARCWPAVVDWISITPNGLTRCIDFEEDAGRSVANQRVTVGQPLRAADVSRVEVGG